MSGIPALLAVLCIFHVSEFVLAAIFMRDDLGWHSWLFSKQYCAAMMLGVAEYVLELRLVPGLKAQVWVSAAGLAMVMLGEGIRKTAMVTAGRAFTHRVQHTKRVDHRLVTHGIYRWIRHPGYLGWFIWAVGTQVMLANPVCAVAYAIVALRFFKQRILPEERLLRGFFGARYEEYAQRTPTYLPYIP